MATPNTMQAAEGDESSQRCLRRLALQHGQYGDELQSHGAYRAAKSHYHEALRVAERLDAMDEEQGDDVNEDVSSLRFHRSLLDNDERFRSERLNLVALIAFDKGRHVASGELFDALLETHLDTETRSAFTAKRSRAIKVCFRRFSPKF
jgi:hypothetical protein